MMVSTMSGRAKGWEKAAAVLLALTVWQIGAAILGSQLLLVSPLVVLRRLLQLCLELSFYSSVWFSFGRIVAGYGLALCAGTLLAILASRFHRAEVLLWPYITVIKTTPVASFIILCLIWLDSSSLPVFISFLMVLPIIYTNMLQGIRETDPKLLEMARLFRMRWPRRLLYIYLPQLKPYLLSACSVSLGLSWKAGIAAEVIGIPDGSIGEQLYDAKVYLSSADLFAWTVVIIAISILFEKLFLWLLHTGYQKMERI